MKSDPIASLQPSLAAVALRLYCLPDTTIDIILWGFLMFCQIFLSPQVKRSLIVSNKLVYTSCLTSSPTTSDLGS